MPAFWFKLAIKIAFATIYISKSPDAQGRFRPRQVIPRAKGWFGLKSLPRAQPAGVISTQINPMPEGLLDEV